MDCVATANLHRLALWMVLPVSRNKSHARVRAGNQADGSPDRMIISPGISYAFVEANRRQSPPSLGSNRTKRRPDHGAADGPGDPAHAAHGNHRVQVVPPPSTLRFIGASQDCPRMRARPRFGNWRRAGAAWRSLSLRDKFAVSSEDE